MHLKIGVALCPPTSQWTAQPWPESPLSIIAPMHSVHSILRVRVIVRINDHDHGDSTEVSDGDDKGGDNDEDGDSFKDNEDIYDIFLLLTCWRYVWYENQK